MSVSSKRGKDFETRIAKLMRQKGFKAFRDSRSGAGDLYKADISCPGFFFNIEAKNQETIKVLDWWRQSRAGCPGYKRPLLLMDTKEGDLAVLEFSDLLDLIKTISDDTDTIAALRRSQ